MRRLLPHPLLSVLLLTVWLLLVQSADAGSLLLGALLAVFWPLATADLRPVRTRIRHPRKVLRLFAQVVQAMIHSSLEVAWAILTKRPRALRSAFVRIPLELTDPGGLAALAAIVTFTPGTAWAQLSADHRVLVLHALEVSSEEALVAQIHRYERSLKEIFE